ncbi:MAG: hypothetical protein MJ252_04870, partial [archaeon]|nr:hypothetical protein [archaeon]
VNLAARLETATNIFGVDILISGQMYNMISPFLKNYFRKIDVVNLKGSLKPMALYTIDINKDIKPGKINSKKNNMSMREKRAYYNMKKTKMWEKYEIEKKLKKEKEGKNQFQLKTGLSISEFYFKYSKGIRELTQRKKGKLFYECFEKGINNYISGNWSEALTWLNKSKYLCEKDGPTNTILKYMKSFDYKCPEDWKQCRALTSKT